MAQRKKAILHLLTPLGKYPRCMPRPKNREYLQPEYKHIIIYYILGSTVDASQTLKQTLSAPVISAHVYKYIYIYMDSLITYIRNIVRNIYIITMNTYTPLEKRHTKKYCQIWYVIHFACRTLWYFFACPVHNKITTKLAVNVTSRHMARPLLNGANLRLFPWGGQFHFGSSVFSLGQGQLEIFLFPDGPYGTAMI